MHFPHKNLTFWFFEPLVVWSIVYGPVITHNFFYCPLRLISLQPFRLHFLFPQTPPEKERRGFYPYDFVSSSKMVLWINPSPLSVKNLAHQSVACDYVLMAQERAYREVARFTLRLPFFEGRAIAKSNLFFVISFVNLSPCLLFNCKDMKNLSKIQLFFDLFSLF